MSFIFQAKPSIYDLKLKLYPGKTVGWIASRYQKEMQRGDIVYLWRAGSEKERGIYGWGKIESDGVFLDSSKQYRVSVKYEKRFFKNDKDYHINVSSIQNDPVLKDLLILRNAMGTNFSLTKQEEQAIQNLILSDLGPGFLPQVKGGQNV